MSVPENDDIEARLKELEAEEQRLSVHRASLHERLASFPNEITEEKERELSARRRELHVEIDSLRAERSKRRNEQHGG